MNTFDLLKFVGLMVWKPLLQGLLVIFTLRYLVVINFASIILSVMVWYLIFRLLSESWNGDVPVVKEWLFGSLKAFGVVLFFMFLFFIFGGLGVLGFLIILFGLAGFQIYRNWSLFDAVTTWGAERVTGKHKEVFDLEKNNKL